jgi:hypothetical protein
LCHVPSCLQTLSLQCESTVVHTWWPHSDHCRTK